MIRTVAELLSGILKENLAVLDASGVKHPPTIGAMYEGLSRDLLERAIPADLGLRLVTGFATDGAEAFSGQLDCMLVRGTGTKLPYIDAYVWHVKDIIAVFEVKKTLYSAPLADALDQLGTVRKLEVSYARSGLVGPVARQRLEPALRAFSQVTGRIAPSFDALDTLPVDQRLILQTLIEEQQSIIRVALGLHGFKSEGTFRDALSTLAQDKVGVDGYGPGGFPQLIVSGSFSAVKANGLPYVARSEDGAWPFYCSTRANPLLVLLEVLWTRLELLFPLPYLWGEDLVHETLRGLFLAIGREAEGHHGWDIRILGGADGSLDELDAEEDWVPVYVSELEASTLLRLAHEGRVHLDDAGLRDDLLRSGLVAADGDELRLAVLAVGVAVLPTGEWVAADNATGRLTRWVHKHTTSGS